VQEKKNLVIFICDTENLSGPLENRLNSLIYKEHEEFTFNQKGEANIYQKCPQTGVNSGVEPTKNPKKRST